MSPLPADSFALVLLVFVLGVKHGFDADHLATIDGLTRYNARARPRMARFCGGLFSLGHGAVVVAIALGVSLLSGGWSAPEWLEFSGAWISIAFLVLLGVLNLRAVFAAEAHEVVRPVGLKGRWLGRLARVSDPAGVAMVGALFALSFDTVSQAALARNDRAILRREQGNRCLSGTSIIDCANAHSESRPEPHVRQQRPDQIQEARDGSRRGVHAALAGREDA